jgi:hypothetical protein
MKLVNRFLAWLGKFESPSHKRVAEAMYLNSNK